MKRHSFPMMKYAKKLLISWPPRPHFDPYIADDLLEGEYPSAGGNFDLRSGGVAGGEYTRPGDFLSNAANKAHGVDAVSAFSSLSHGRQGIRRNDWKRWIYFGRGYGCNPWLPPGMLGRGELAINFITHEHTVLGVRSSSIRGEISGIMSYRIVDGGGGDLRPMSRCINR